MLDNFASPEIPRTISFDCYVHLYKALNCVITNVTELPRSEEKPKYNWKYFNWFSILFAGNFIHRRKSNDGN